MAKIKKRQALNKAYKTKAAKRLGTYGIVLQFIEAMETIVTEAKGPLDFETGLEREAGLLHDRMRCIDPDVDIELRWNKESSTELWQDLQIEGVLIKWSRFYKKEYPLNDPEKYIDIAQLFLEGFISDEE